jgi:hypothetical protein
LVRKYSHTIYIVYINCLFVFVNVCLFIVYLITYRKSCITLYLQCSCFWCVKHYYASTVLYIIVLYFLLRISPSSCIFRFGIAYSDDKHFRYSVGSAYSTSSNITRLKGIVKENANEHWIVELHSTLDPNTVPERPTWIEFDNIFNSHGLLIFHLRIRVDNYGTYVTDLPVANPTLLTVDGSTIFASCAQHILTAVVYLSLAGGYSFIFVSLFCWL